MKVRVRPNWPWCGAIRDLPSTIGASMRSALSCFVIIPLVVGLPTELRALDLYWDINGVLPGATNSSAADGFWSNNSWSIDPSGGSADSFTLAVAHKDRDKRIVIDAVRERRPPFSPEDVVEEYAAVLKTYRVSSVTGDRYAGEFPRELFRKHGVNYELSEQTKSDLFRDLLPRLNSGSILLPRHDRLISQLVSLERTVSRGGRDTISHPVGGHDDVANAIAGAAVLAGRYGGYNLELLKRAFPDHDDPDA